MLHRTNISKAVIKRLPRYYRHLGELQESGVERISSRELSRRMHVTASQIRQDLNHFGGFGQQGYGYNVSDLYREIGNILGLDRKYHMIIIGAGNLGKAIANYTKFERSGFLIIGIFDNNVELKGKSIRGIPVRMMEELETFTKNEKVDIAALTIPKAEAVKVADKVVKCGIKAIWNFAHVDLELPNDVVVESVHLSESLMRISYNLSGLEEKKNGQT